MKNINCYLTFNGNCREAMTFYKECFDGELTLQTIGESPMAERMPPKMQQCILHATLINGNVSILGSDMVSEKGLIKGNSVSMMLDCSSEEEIRRVHAQLASKGGSVLHPLEITFWGALFGDVYDQFGNIWILQFDKNAK